MSENLVNILVSGIGGQGVVSLSKWIRELAAMSGYCCVGATFKGGAQRMGSVYSELRIYKENKEKLLISSQIPLGAVDVLIALEPWEALRFANRCNTKTLAVINSHEEKLYVERYNKKSFSFHDKIISTYPNSQYIDFTKISEQASNSKKDLNKTMLLQTIKKGLLPFKEEHFYQILNRIEE